MNPDWWKLAGLVLGLASAAFMCWLIYRLLR